MATAGRILIMPKGAYDASATYEMLDMVSHDGATWLAKKTSVEIAPSNANSEYWFKMVGISASDLNELKNEILGTVDDQIDDTNSSIQNVSNALKNYVPFAGGNMTGALKAVNPGVGTEGVRNITAGTTDLVAGSSALATGAIHIVYE